MPAETEPTPHARHEPAMAQTPEPPYYAVIFSSVAADRDDEDYEAMADEMFALASRQPGYLGVESAPGITISYWTDEAAIASWKAQPDHLDAQAAGRDRFYERYVTRVARVERSYDFDAGSDR